MQTLMFVLLDGASQQEKKECVRQTAIASVALLESKTTRKEASETDQRGWREGTCYNSMLLVVNRMFGGPIVGGAEKGIA